MQTFHRLDARAIGALTLAALAPAARAHGRKEADADPFALARAETGAETETEAEAESALRFSAAEGLRLTLPESGIDVRFGGRIHNDWGWHSADDALEMAAGPFVDGTEFRRARFYAVGTVYENVEVKAEYDFGAGDVDFTDVYVGLKGVAGGTVRVGHQKEPFGLEWATSGNHVTFLERGLPHALNPERNTGIAYHGDCSDKTVTYGLGVFRPADNFGNDKSGADGEYSVTGRVTWIPMHDEDDTELLHLGLSYSLRSDDGGSTSFSSRPEDHLDPKIVSTGAIASDGDDRGALEIAWVDGPLSLQGEYMTSAVDGTAGDADFSGFYGFVSYFLTGEHRPYKRSSGGFGQVAPKHDYGAEGSGAWELAARYSSLDLTDGGVVGGELDDVTLGVNWYLNPAARVMLNYVMSDWDGGAVDGDAESLLLRFDVHF